MIDKLRLPESKSLQEEDRSMPLAEFDKWVTRNFRSLDPATVERVRSQASRQPVSVRFRIHAMSDSR